MPIGPYKPIVGSKPHDPSLWDRIGGLPGVVATGVRGVSGAMSAPGGLVGSAISAGGEGIAESIENLGQIPEAIKSIPEVYGHLKENPLRTLNDLFSGAATPIARIGTEAAIGAVPFGAVLKEGRPVASALRGAVHAGTGAAAREVARGEEIDPTSVGIAAGTGGLITGGLAALLGGRVPKAPTGDLFEVEPTAVPGGRVLEGKAGSTIPQHPRPIRGTASTAPDPTAWMKEDLNKLFPEAAEEAGRVPYSSEQPAPYRASARGAVKAEEKANLASIKAEKEAAAATKIAEAREGMVAHPPSISETTTAPTPTGSERLTQKWGLPEEDEEGGGLLDMLSGGGGGVRPPRPPKLRAGVDLETGAPVEARSAEEAFQGWLGKTGLPDTPSTRSQFPWGMWGMKHDAGRLDPRAVARAAEESGEVAETALVPEVLPSPLEAILQGRNTARSTAVAEGRPVFERAFEGPVPPPKVFEPEVLPAEPEIPVAPHQEFGAYPSPEATGEDIMPLTQDSIARAKAAADAERASAGLGPAPSLEDLGVEGPRSVGRGRTPGATPQLPAGPPETPSNLLGDEDPYSMGGASVEGITPEAAPEGPLAQLMNLFKSRVDAAGQGYRDIKAAKAAGEQVPEEGRAAAGAALKREAQEVGLPTGKAAKVAPEAPQAPSEGSVAPGVGQTSKAREAAAAARAAKRGEKAANAPLTGSKLADLFKTQGRGDLAEQQGSKFGSEKGAVEVPLLAELLKTGVGAAIGGVVGGAAGHPYLGMAGGAAVANAPQILSQLGAHPDTFNNLNEKLNTEGIKETASKIWHTLPQIQRFNFLADAKGLPANAAFGPYGSAVMAALEHGLSGDPRGWTALKTLTPGRFWQEYRSAGQEAMELIQHGEAGRADTGQQLIGPMIPGEILGMASGSKVPPLQIPGVMMTAGDVASRKILEEAGFSADEARRITLTSEPESMLPKAIANLGKGERDVTSPLMDLMLPFKRTPANIWEQGAQRAPGIGFLMQQMGREVPDPIVQQVVQQLMSVGVGGASAWAGANLDPETAKIVRRYIQNFAGQYGAAATAGFAAGQAMRSGKDMAPAAATATINSLPLPATDTLQDIAGFLTGKGSIPRGMLPPQVRDLVASPAEPPSQRLVYKPIR